MPADPGHKVRRSLAIECRHAWRLLRSAPAAVATAVVLLGVAVGASVSVFAVVDALMLRTIATPEPDRLLTMSLVTAAGEPLGFSKSAFERLAASQKVIRPAFAWYGDAVVTVEAEGRSALANVWAVSDDYFAALQPRPVLGRFFGPTGDARATDDVAVIGFGFWQRRFGGAHDVVGRTIRVEGRPFVIAGVTGEGFSGLSIGVAPDVTVRLTSLRSLIGAPLSDSAWLGLDVGGRLAPGTHLAEACAAIDAWWRAGGRSAVAPVQADVRDLVLSSRVRCESAAGGVDSAVRAHVVAPYYALLGLAVAMVVAGGLHVATLMVHVVGRQARDVAVRVALGATRGAVVREVWIGSAMLAAAASALGAVIAAGGSRYLLSVVYAKGVMPPAVAVEVSVAVVAFSALMASATCLLCGVAPSLWILRTGQTRLIAVPSQGQAASVDTAGRVLIAAQLAITVAIGAAAASLTQHLGAWRSGLETTRLSVLRLYPQPDGYSRLVDRQYYPRLIEEVRSLPGVSGAALSNLDPGGISPTAVRLSVAAADARSMQAALALVSPETLPLLGVSLLRGRHVRWSDASETARVVVVGRHLADALFANGEAIGRVVRVGDEPGAIAATVVGIVADTPAFDVQQPHRSMLYLPWLQWPDHARWAARLVIRRDGSSAGAVDAAVRSRVTGLSHEYVLSAASVGEVTAVALSQERLAARAGMLFSGLAAWLVALGSFATVSSFVAQRRRELGIRMALGASSNDVLRVCFRHTRTMVAVGAGSGVLLAFATFRILRHSIEHLSELSMAVPAATAAATIAVWAVATYLPGRRAARLSPSVSMRTTP